jgi:hypothetical protein
MSAEIVMLRRAAARPHEVATLVPLPNTFTRAPPLHAMPRRFGNGRVEVQVYPAATAADRVAAAVTLLEGTGWRVTGRDG